MANTTYPQFFTEKDYRIDPPEVRDRKIEALVKAMTFDEKLSLLGGSKEPEDKGKIGNEPASLVEHDHEDHDQQEAEDYRLGTNAHGVLSQRGADRLLA